jgi:hypothetical protein
MSERRQDNGPHGRADGLGEAPAAASSEKAEKPDRKRIPQRAGMVRVKRFGWLCFLFGFIGFAVIFRSASSVDTSPEAAEALKTGMSSTLKPGTVLASVETAVERFDYEAAVQDDAPLIELLVWDYAAEDGDYIRVFVDDEPVTEAFVLTHKPVALTVPSAGLLRIWGIRDGGGGITCALHARNTGTSWFNTVAEGESVTYRLRRGP